MKIDIISSIFNSEEYLSTFLINVCNQTIFKDCFLHIISPSINEKEKRILNFFLNKHSNIKVTDLQKKSSIYESWNIAIKNSSSEYITNMNCDDCKYPHSLERHLLEIDSQEDIDLVFSDSFLATSKNISLFDTRLKMAYKFPDEISIENLLKYNPPHQSPMWRRSLHDRFGFFDEKMFSASDAEFWLRCYHGGAKFKKINEILNIYYFNPRGVSTSSDREAERIKEEEDNKIKYAKMFNYTGDINGNFEDIIYKI